MIPVSQPIIAKNASKYILECLKTGWISSAGSFVQRFEKKFAVFTNTKYSVACNSGTNALHLALLALDVSKSDEVIAPALTMISTVLPIVYTGATPVLVDVEKETGNINPTLIEEKITKKTKAIMVVHHQGHPADMSPILKLAKKHKLFVIEDAAEAHGAEYKFKIQNSKFKIQKVGSIGDIGCFSFYANKIITTGEGGMATTNNKKLAERMRSLGNLARTPKKHFFHSELAFNYHLSNLQAALGLAQLEEANVFITKKRAIARLYTELLKNVTSIELLPQQIYAQSVFWQYCILIKKQLPISRDQLANILWKNGIETRTFFIPMHQQPAFKKLGLFKNERYPVSEDLSKRGLCLPSGLTLKDSDINFVASVIKKALK